MGNSNLKVETTCPRCKETREARGDVVRKAEREGRVLFCKPCRNQTRFADQAHPRKGTGVKNDPDRLAARNSYYTAKRRCKLGKKHHPAYAAVLFKFTSFDEFFGLLGPRPEGHTLDRIDTLGHYEPGNVRWSTYSEQSSNRMPNGYWVDGDGSQLHGQTAHRQ